MIPNRSDLADETRVVVGQARVMEVARAHEEATSAELEASIVRAEALAGSLDISLPQQPSVPAAPMYPAAPPPPFAKLFADAPRDVGLHDALDEDEIEVTLARLYASSRRPRSQTKLDRWDWAIAGTAGLLAGAADIALVGLPATLPVRMRPLPRGVHAAFDRLLPPKRIRALEKACRVPFDASTNRQLRQHIRGLYPSSHRFHALGHDPLLGWVVGVKDVLRSEFTAIGRDGRLLVQAGPNVNVPGQNIFVGLIEALQRVGGHMLSDVHTPKGLPAPLMPLLQFLQFGKFGDKQRTIAELAWYIYAKGYDFRHFVAGGISTVIVEALVRGAWLARRLDEGRALKDALPNDGIPRLRRQLVLGHATAAAMNAGKIAVQRNPLALNWAQWLVLLRHVVPEMIDQAREPSRRADAIDEMLDDQLRALASA